MNESLFNKNCFHILKSQLNGPFLTPDFLVKEHFPSLNGWRAIGIILVLLGHLQNNQLSTSNYYKIADLIIFPELGVRIFFVLSGFLITTLLIKEFQKNKKINLRIFFIKRALRLFPVLFLYLISIFLLSTFLQLGINYSSFIGAAFYFSNFMTYDRGWYIGHTWSLAVEEQFYLLWPFIFVFFQHKAWIFSSLLIFSIPFFKLFWYYKPQYFNISLGPFLNNADAIFSGTLLSFLCFKGFINTGQMIWTKKWLNILFVLIPLFIFYCRIQGLFGFIVHPFGNFASDFSVCYLIIQTILITKSILFKILNHPVMVEIGIISYSIYIWQQLFLVQSNIWHPVLYWQKFPINIILIFVVSYISYYYFERYFIKLKYRLARS